MRHRAAALREGGHGENMERQRSRPAYLVWALLPE